MGVSATVLLLAASAAAARTRQSLNLGWRHHLGDAVAPPSNSSSCSATSFPLPLNNVQCLELLPFTTASTKDACIAACCATSACSVWQFSATEGCWAGSSCLQLGPEKAGWVGGATNGTVCTRGACLRDFDDSAWEVVNAPHDFLISGQFDHGIDPNHGSLPRNSSWYRMNFSVAADLEGQLVWATFDGAYRAVDVYINGAFVLHHEEGYTSFVAYLHNASAPLRYGPGADGTNVLALYVDARDSEMWCYEGGGLYRHVWLESAPALSFVPWSLYAPTYVSGGISGASASAAQTADQALLLPQVDVHNAGSAAAAGTVTFTLTLLPAVGSGDASAAPAVTVSTPFSVGPGGWQRVSVGATPFGSPSDPVQLWNTAAAPPLYLATATLALSSDPATAVDAVSARVGVRSAVFDPRLGFLLNGIKVPIRGTSNHLGFGGLGMAVPDRVAEFQLATLRRMGSNAWRGAHNPVAPELLDLADEYGMLVWEENRFITAGVQPVAASRSSMARRADEPHPQDSAAAAVSASGADVPSAIPAADPRLLQDAQDMVLRDRNHPSIIIWSLCNELGCVANDPTGGTLAQQFKQAVYAADQSRPVTGNTVQPPYLSGRLVDPFSQAMDVQSFSYNYDAYLAYHAQAPFKPVGGGESASCVTDRGYYGTTDGAAGHLGPSADIQGGLFACAAAGWASVAELPHVYGNFAWTGFDYMGEVYPLAAPDVSSHFGIHDLAGYRKDGADYYTAWWRDAPSGCAGTAIGVGVSPSHWTAPVPVGSPIDVTVTTCAPFVELFLNGQRVGEAQQPMPVHRYVTFPAVAYAPGNLTAVAYDASGAAQAARSVLTAGAPVRLEVWVEEVGRAGPNITADGGDAALIGVALVDASGRLVPNADVNVSFTIQGPAALAGVANGDPADTSPVKAPWRRTFHGLARAIVTSSAPGATGAVTVTAAAPGVEPGSATLHAMVAGADGRGNRGGGGAWA